jgi:hypothetical protein
MMTWSGSIAVTDCDTKQALQATASVSGRAWNSNPSGIINVDIDDSEATLSVEVWADGHEFEIATFVKSKGAAENALKLCLPQLPQGSPPHVKVAPVDITAFDVNGGVFTVSWNAGEADHFIVALQALDGPFVGQPGPGGHDIDGDKRSYSQGNIISLHNYRFSIKRCRKGFLQPSNCSDWVLKDFFVPAEKGILVTWGGLGGTLTEDPVVASNADGRLEVFVRGHDNALYHIWQTGSGWSGWAGLGGTLTSNIAIGRNADGRLEAFVRGGDNALYHT